MRQGARSQVAAVFDAQEAQLVHTAIGAAEGVARFTDIDLDRFAGLAGIRASGSFELWDSVPVQNGVRTAPGATVAVVSGHAFEAVLAEVRWAPRRTALERPAEAVVGRALADQLGLGHLARAPEVAVGGDPYVVVGILERSTQPLLQGALLTTAYESERASSDGWVDARTSAGAARQVAGQAAVALDPYRPDRIEVAPVPDPDELRGALEGSVSAVLLALTAVALLAATATLISIMALVVSGRRVELGLRRALGARRSDLAWQVAVEAGAAGLLGGVVGLFSAFVVLHGAFAVQGWRPVFDLWLAPLAVGLGIVVGALAGSVPAHLASRVDPIVALRGVERT
jgi:macrolide transport system ATP-binding/permease protein